jgi:hypothetical protein
VREERAATGVENPWLGRVVPDHRRVLRPHPPVSRARGDFTPQPLIPRAFAVRAPRCQASSCSDRVATHEARLCQPCLTG